MNHIYIISDGTGGTANQALKAALTQFPNVEVDVNIRPNIRSAKQVLNVVEEAVENKGFILHTLVTLELRDLLLEAGRLNNVETIDLMGPLLAQLTHQFSYLPAEEPGLFHELNKAYFQRIEALEFAFRHDDGQHVDELQKAEIVLLGVSRTFKTPLSMYLAFKGWFVANVPIILDLEPPTILSELPSENIFGLTANPASLAELRQIRHKYLGGSTGDYAKISHVYQELIYAQQFYAKNPKWSVINVTSKPIEEIGSEILSIIRKSKKLEDSNNDIAVR